MLSDGEMQVVRQGSWRRGEGGVMGKERTPSLFIVLMRTAGRQF
jgi:hypothetical protein